MAYMGDCLTSRLLPEFDGKDTSRAVLIGYFESMYRVEELKALTTIPVTDAGHNIPVVVYPSTNTDLAHTNHNSCSSTVVMT